MWITLLETTVLLLAVWTLLKYLNRKYFILALTKRVKTQDGSPLESKVFVLPGKTIFGNNMDLLNLTPRDSFISFRNFCAKAKGRSYLMYTVLGPVYNVVRAEDVEEVLQSPKLINKSIMYELTRPVLGDGLLISTDNKWHTRRKMLMSSFNFSVLQDFLDIFKDETRKFIDVLDRNMGIDLDIGNMVTHFTINNICETAMGVKLDDMDEGEQYHDAFQILESIMAQRFCNPLMFWRPFFYFFGSYQKHVTNLKIVHEFSSQIIERRRQLFANQQDKDLSGFGQKKRFAMLDTLLQAEKEGLIDHQGICDEVNTFIFGGYDTLATCLIFTLLLLALHEDVQERCFEEVESLPENYNELTVFHLNNMTYMECVIKESLRLFPPVSFNARLCVEESLVNGLIMPKGTQIVIHSYDILRDPKHFPNPTKFQPDRFLPENTVNRHPFAFIPFSAGQRNCIGQKFAMLEAKAFLVSLLRNFKLLPVTQLGDIILEYGIVLRSQNRVNIRFKSR